MKNYFSLFFIHVIFLVLYRKLRMSVRLSLQNLHHDFRENKEKEAINCTMIKNLSIND